MKLPDLQIRSPQFQLDGEATRQMAAYTAKLEEILLDIYQKLGTVTVVSSAPTINELQETGLSSGKIRSDVIILDDATQSSRKLYYRFKDNLRLIDSA